ncbi:MAG: class I SAM-dependent methyltransferase [Pseudomonadales bacterium]
MLGSLLVAVLFAGCASQSADNQTLRLRGALADPGRSAADQARDAGRAPAAVMTFLGVGAGMTTMDLIASSGYYSEVMAAAVGPTGRVYAQNPAQVLRFRDGANDKAMKARLGGNRLPNVVRWDREFDNIGLPPKSLDVALTALNFHDVYYGTPDQAAGFLGVVFELLKPGGVLGIIDHVGVTGADNAALHRIVPADIERAARAAGFEVSARSELLANTSDNHASNVFAPDVRGQTDRVLYRLTRPE